MKNKINADLPHAIPVDLRNAFAENLAAKAAWDDITLLARNEWICWVISAKKLETRQQRIVSACNDLEIGKRRPCCWPGCSHR